MNPFIYPKVRHQRQFAPKKQYKRYQTYKHLLRLEFNGKCVYCQMPLSLRESGHFGVDHYRPKKLYPGLECEYTNLFYCCNTCNSRKGSYWPSTSAKELTDFIPNPCDHRMFEHLRFAGAMVEGRTQAGRIAIELLDLNDPAAVELRDFFIKTAEIFESNKIRLLRTRQALEQKRKKGGISLADADAASKEIATELAKLDALLNRLHGRV